MNSNRFVWFLTIAAVLGAAPVRAAEEPNIRAVQATASWNPKTFWQHSAATAKASVGLAGQLPRLPSLMGTGS